MPQLYARRPLLQELVPRLTGLAHDRQVRLGHEYRDDLPAVLLTGGHGAGKTVVLDALEEAYAERIPLARHTFVRVDAWAREHDRLTNTSPVVEMLTEAAVSLAPGGAEYGDVPFPRLLPGLVAVSCWVQGEETQRDLAHRRLDRLLAACPPARGGGPLAYGVGEELARANAAEGAGMSPVDELRVIAEALVERYFRTYAPGKDGRRVQQWYRDRDEHAEHGLNALVRLCPAFHHAGEYRRAAERALVAAFLADVTESFGWWKRRNRTPRPLLLLDDVHADGGDHALRLLLESRTPSRGGTPDPLVIVATRLGEADTRRYPDATRLRLSEVVGAPGWSRADGGSPSAGLLELPLAPLSIEDQLAMLEGTDHFLHADLPSVLDRLTAGSPVACRAFCDAVGRATEAGHEVVPEELLELTDADGRRVTEVVLERLVPAPSVRRRLMLQCTAWDAEAADVLAGERPTGVEPLSAAAARTYLASEGWAPDDGPPFITDRLLREVLVQELRHADAAELGVDWAELHARLRAHHRARGAAGEPQMLRHTLATGDDRAVVSRLAACFAEWEAPRWLDCVRQVVTAPHPPRRVWRDERRSTARGDLDRNFADGGPVELSVNRLVHGLWYLSEVTVEPAEQMCTDVGAELEFLSLHHPNGRAALNLAAREWPRAAWHKAPLPVMGLA